MRDYEIITDSCCDLSAEMAEELGVHAQPLMVTLEGENYRNYLDGREISFTDFYAKLRDGKMASTSDVNAEEFIDAMEPILKAGKDVLCLNFSSGLSATYQAAVIVADELRARYPDASIITIDTLAASMGQGLLVYLALRDKRKGSAIPPLAQYMVEAQL